MNFDLSSLKPNSSALRVGASPLRDALLFLGLTILLSWLFWIPGGLLLVNGATDAGNFFLAIGSFIPLLVAFYLNLWAGRSTFELGSWIRTLTLRRVIVAVVLPVLILLPIVLYRLYNNSFDLKQSLSDLRGAPFLLIGLFVIYFGQEVGWRGYLLRRLDSTFKLVLVNLIMAFAWFAWQIPIILALPADAFGGDGATLQAAYLLFSILITPFFNRVALKSDFNVLLPAILRACLQVAFFVYALQGVNSLTHPWGIGSLVWLAVLNVLLFGQLWLGKPSGDESELERVMPLEPAVK